MQFVAKMRDIVAKMKRLRDANGSSKKFPLSAFLPPCLQIGRSHNDAFTSHHHHY